MSTPSGGESSDQHSGMGNGTPGAGTTAIEAKDVETGTVRTNEIDTHYVRQGSGPPIVFVHGMAMSAAEWEPQIAALSDEFTVVAYDVRGHGHTGGSDRASYSMELFASDLDALLSALDVERPVLCGLSMGGCIAQTFAATRPDEVSGLVLADTFTAAPLPLSGRLVFANLRVLGALDRIVRYTTLNRLQTWVGNRLAPGVAGDGAATQRLMEAAPTIPHAEFRKIARAVAAFPASDFDAARIDVPTLVVHGEHVPPVLREMHDALAVSLVNATVTRAIVPDAGHASNVDNPEAFSAAVRAFCARVAGERRG